MSEELFIRASREALRFPYKNCNVEGLWLISDSEFDDLFDRLSSQVTATRRPGLSRRPTKEEQTLKLQIDIMTFVESVRLAERTARETAAKNKKLREMYLRIAEENELEEVKKLSPAELRLLAASL